MLTIPINQGSVLSVGSFFEEWSKEYRKQDHLNYSKRADHGVSGLHFNKSSFSSDRHSQHFLQTSDLFLWKFINFVLMRILQNSKPV